MNGANSSISSQGGLSLGSFGLVDLSALTSVIGSSTAETLALGDRGPAGLAWTALSAFSFVSVVKGCISGACPSYFRERLANSGDTSYKNMRGTV